MDSKKIFDELASYNTWANYQIIHWLKDKDPKLLTEKIPSSFSTLKSTFLHIWDAERYWLAFLEKKSKTEFREDYKQSASLFFEGIHRQSHRFEMFVHSLTEEQLQEEFIVDTAWLKGKKPCYCFIQHVVNHSTYHRGQLITLGRNLGLEYPPNTDYSKFLIEVNH